MFKVSTIGLHASLQAFCEVLDGLVDWLLWHVVCRPILTAERLSALPLSLASAAVCDTYATWPPICDSQGGSDLDNLVATGPSQSSQDRTVGVQPLLRDTCCVRRSAVLLKNPVASTRQQIFCTVLNLQFLSEYARIIALAPSPCSHSVCIRTLSICDTFPIVTALS